MEKFLFCLGVTKGGTTWLHWVLSQHPELAFIARKEIHYFLRQHGGIDRLTDFARMRHFADHVGNYGLHRQDDKKGLLERSSSEDYGMPWDAAMERAWSENGPCTKKHRRLMRGVNWYRNYLRGPINDDWYRSLFSHVPETQWPSDFSTTGLQCKSSGLKHMSEIAEDCRAIVILRDPIERLWSHVKFHAQLTGDVDNLANWSNERILEFVELFDLHTNSFYGDGMEGLVEHFKPEKRLVINFSDLSERPEALLKDVLDFLDMKPMAMPTRKGSEQRVNVSKSVRMPEGLFEKYAPQFEKDLLRVKACGIDFVDPWIDNARNHAAKGSAPKKPAQPHVESPASKPFLGKAKQLLTGR